MFFDFRKFFIASLFINLVLLTVFLLQQSNISLFTLNPEQPKIPFNPKYAKIRALPVPDEAIPKEIVYTGEIGENETLSDALLQYAGVTPQMVHDLVKSMKGSFDFRNCHEGHSYELALSPDYKTLRRFVYTESRVNSYTVINKNGLYSVQKEVKDTDKKTVFVQGTLQDSLYATITKMGETPYLAGEVVKMFEYDIDFYSESKEGDSFGVLVEKEYLNGEFLRYGKILYGFYNGKSTGNKEGYYFKSADSKIYGYFNAQGKYTQKAFLKTPVDIGKVTSKFGMRFHPVWQKMKFHNGVDYGAPTGTPVFSVADGTVSFAGHKSGDGNLVIIKHQQGFISLYGHLSKIFVRGGQKVAQRMRIGSVGSTGISTGPHLHFGLLLNGKHTDPTKRKLVPIMTLPNTYLAEFRNNMVALNTLKNQTMASVEPASKSKVN